MRLQFQQADSNCQASWKVINNLILLHNPKNPASFYSGHQNTETNPDLAFLSVGSDNCLPDRLILKKFSKSQHRPLCIVPPEFALPTPSRPVKC